LTRTAIERYLESPGFGGLERVQDLDRHLWIHRRFAGECAPGTLSFG
jgi:hypothetical protein